MSIALHEVADIHDAPERAVLAVLGVALVMAEHALTCEHPTARDAMSRWDGDAHAAPVVAAARDVLNAARALRRHLQHYECAVADVLEPSNVRCGSVLPF